MKKIHTARSIKAMNEAAEKGYYPLVVAINPDPRFINRIFVRQNIETGKIAASAHRPGCGFRSSRDSTVDDQEETVFQTKEFYPHNQRLPFGAYLIPSDLAAGERVLVLDVIEDIVKSKHNICVPSLVTTQYTRLEQCEAIWDGKSLELDWDESKVSEDSLVG